MAHSHSHFGDLARQTTTRIALALGFTLAFVVIEAVAGYWSNSLALLSDAVHNVTDAIALGLSWYAMRLTARPANSQKTFGYHRAGILVALANSASLVLIALGILREAYLRFLFPAAVEANILIGVGLLAAHIVTGEVSPGTHVQIRRAVNEVLSHNYNITHVTLQLESEGCDPAGLYCDMANAAPQRQHSH